MDRHDESALQFLQEIPDPLAVERPRPSPAAAPLPASLGSAPTRRTVRQRRLAAGLLSAAWLLAHLSFYGLRPDLSRLPLWYLVSQIALPLLLAATSLAVALHRGKLGLGARTVLLLSCVVLGPLAFATVALGVPEPHPASAVPFWSALVSCFVLTSLWAALPLLAAAFALRRAFAAGATWRSALIGAGAGLASGAAMNLHCSNVDGVHIALGHGVPIGIAAAAGALVLAKRLRI
jgi:hypothetical protein